MSEKQTQLEGQTQGNKVPARDELGRLLPGNTANPCGRPMGQRTLQAFFEALMASPYDGTGLTNAEILVVEGLRRAREGDYRYWEHLLNRALGKVPDRVLQVLAKGWSVAYGANGDGEPNHNAISDNVLGYINSEKKNPPDDNPAEDKDL